MPVCRCPFVHLCIYFAEMERERERRERERECVCVHAGVCECVYVRMCVYCKRVFVCVASAISNVVKSRGHADLYNSWNTGLHWSWLYRQTQEDRDLT